MDSEGSVQSTPSIFIEEADNLPLMSSVGDFSPTKIQNKLASGGTGAALAMLKPAISGDSIQSPVLSPGKDIATKPLGKRFDIDSLNEVKRDVALQSKKIEITNQIWNQVFQEVMKDLFPSRQTD